MGVCQQNGFKRAQFPKNEAQDIKELGGDISRGSMRFSLRKLEQVALKMRRIQK